MGEKKVKSIRELSKIVNRRRENKIIVFTNGCFDLLHMGHVRYLKKAKSLGDILIVGINSDNSVRKIKGKKRPITPEKERAEIIASLGCVDYVTIFNDTTPNKVIKILKPDIHVKGGDYKINEVPESKIVESYGGKTIILGKVKNKSTKNIIEKILRLCR